MGALRSRFVGMLRQRVANKTDAIIKSSAAPAKYSYISLGVLPADCFSSCLSIFSAAACANAVRSVELFIMKKSPPVSRASMARVSGCSLLITCLPSASCHMPFSCFGSGMVAPSVVPIPTVMMSRFFLRASSNRAGEKSMVSSPSLKITKALVPVAAVRSKFCMASFKTCSKLEPP